jgi:hypothetical protein
MRLIGLVAVEACSSDKARYQKSKLSILQVAILGQAEFLASLGDPFNP